MDNRQEKKNNKLFEKCYDSQHFYAMKKKNNNCSGFGSFYETQVNCVLYNLVILLWVINPTERHTYVHHDTFTETFIPTSLTLKLPPTLEWVSLSWHGPTMHCNRIQRNGFQMHTVIQIGLIGIILEIDDKPKRIYYIRQKSKKKLYMLPEVRIPHRKVSDMGFSGCSTSHLGSYFIIILAYQYWSKWILYGFLCI